MAIQDNPSNLPVNHEGDNAGAPAPAAAPNQDAGAQDTNTQTQDNVVQGAFKLEGAAAQTAEPVKRGGRKPGSRNRPLEERLAEKTKRDSLMSPFLSQTIELFENSPEVQNFIVRPPKEPGHLYLFEEPYFHCSTQGYTRLRPSLELLMLAYAMNSSLEFYINNSVRDYSAVRRGQLRALLAPVGLVLVKGQGVALNDENRQIKTMADRNAFGVDGEYPVGIRTKVGIFPINTNLKLFSGALSLGMGRPLNHVVPGTK